MNVNLTPPPEREFPAARLEQRKEQLVSRIEAEQRRPPRQPLHRRRWPLAAIAATAGAAVAATTLLLTGSSGGPSRAEILSVLRYIQSPPRAGREHGGRKLAAVVLLDAARTAGNQPPPAPLGPGQFIYTKVKALWGVYEEGPNGPVAIAFQEHTREDWNRPDGSGRDHDVEGHMLFPTAADAAHFYKHYPSRLINGHTGDETYGPGPPNYDQLSKAPTDPATLKQLIDDRKLGSGPPGDAETFQIIGDLLRRTGAPPAVRSALYTIASQLPGVQLIGPTHDQLGRPGIGVAYDSRGESSELIFDPQTSGLLAEQTSVVERSKDDPFPPGTVISWSAYLASGVVDSSTATTSAAP